MDMAIALPTFPSVAAASMGPCPFRHGYPSQIFDWGESTECFNGAMPFQAWISPEGSCPCSPPWCFNGAMPFQAWISTQVFVKSISVCCFNGAMPFQAWISQPDIRLGGKYRMLQWGHALSGMDIAGRQLSMLPSLVLQWGHALSGMDINTSIRQIYKRVLLQWGHALSGMDIPHQSCQVSIPAHCFNGAMPFQAWICGSRSFLTFSRTLLQWGHALSGMDIDTAQIISPTTGPASMGPCPFRHGYKRLIV